MSHLDLTTGLNPPQATAVAHKNGPLLVLAGAGSGKTRVITYRILNLIQNGVHPGHICAVTFTNKAAQEMKSRLRKLAGKPLRGLFAGTYHSLGLKIIKENIEFTDLQENFSIQNQDDQIGIVHDIMIEFNIDPEIIPEKTMLSNFSQAKNTGLPMSQIADLLDRKLGQPWADAFIRYQQVLRNMNSVDFDDLILLPRDMLKTHDELQFRYHKRWQFFLADEFQDTNPLQFEFLKLLLTDQNNLCAVGDDDQSIYGWRGADVRIILDFKNSFKDAAIVSLEQNYRSTQTILDLANATIVNNADRHQKKLWSAKGEGEPAVILETGDQMDEADSVVNIIQDLHFRKKINFSDFAVLFRTNFQARPFEEYLRKYNIPYYVAGGYQFYDRKEIKDIISYLRFIANHSDERSLIRILNVPKRGIGDSSIQKLLNYSRAEGVRLWQTIEEIESCPVQLNSSVLSGILDFRDLIQAHAADIIRTNNLSVAVGKLVEDIDFEKEFLRSGLEDKVVQAKLLNIRDLMNSISFFENEKERFNLNVKDRDTLLYQYLQYLSLLTSDNENENPEGRVQLMTLHQAKGLEFPVVFMVGMEENIFPHRRSIESEEDDNPWQSGHSLDEERRLFYVGITRAQTRLFFTYAAERKSFNETIDAEPSRFLYELPQSLLEWQTAETDNKDPVDTFNDMIQMLEQMKQQTVSEK